MRTSTFTRAARKFLAASLAAVLALGLMPAFGTGLGGGGRSTASAAEQDESAQLPVGSISNDASEEAGEAAAPPDSAAPEASAQSAATHAADSSGSAGGTTVSIQVYRSSFPIVKWDLNDNDNALTKVEWAWADRTSELPERGTPGAKVEWPEAGMPADYAEPERSGFEFAGWSTDKSAPAGGYLNADPKLAFPEGAPEGGEYTLYALWTPNEYSVVFELAKNPDAGDGPGSDASFALNWSTEDGVRTVTDLGNGRYRVDGFTMKGADYDSATRTVKLPEPARTGYRFLGWAEAADASGVVVDGKDGFALNPVRLPQIDGTPVLTARWASAFGVTAPLSITFGDYDKTGAPGNPSLGEAGSKAAADTTQSEADDTKTEGLSDQERYEALGAAYFENTGWNDPIKMVGIASERDATAGDVLTTYDSKKATEAAVLGDGTAANPGERLLSLYPAASAPVDKSSGVHFRLSDSLAEDDLAALPSIAAKAKQPVTYGLNLRTDPVDGSDNHGLVLPTDDYERKQIATVSYAFATAKAATEEPDPGCFFVRDGDHTYGLPYIKGAADDLSANGTASRYYDQFKGYLDSDVEFQLWVDGSYFPVQLVGICQDTRSDNGKPAGFTFSFKDAWRLGVMNDSDIGTGGWEASQLRTLLQGSGAYAGNGFADKVDTRFRDAVVAVSKTHQLEASEGKGLQTTTDTFFVPSCYEICGTNANAVWNVAESPSSCFQYQWFAQWGATYDSLPERVKNYEGSPVYWWMRSACASNDRGFGGVSSKGSYAFMGASPSIASFPSSACSRGSEADPRNKKRR